MFVCTLVCTACNKTQDEPTAPRPFLVLKGDNPLWHPLSMPFTDPGAKAYITTDEGDTAQLSANIKGKHEINTGEIGLYVIQYDFEDANGSKAETITRKVYVNKLR